MTAKEELREIIAHAIDTAFKVDGGSGDVATFKAQTISLFDGYMDIISEEEAAKRLLAEKNFTSKTHNTPGIFVALSVASYIAYAENHREEPTAAGFKRRMDAFATGDESEETKDYWEEMASFFSPEEDGKKKIKSYKSIAPDKYLIPTGKVPRAMTERESGSAEVIPAHGKTPTVKTSFILHFQDDESIKILGRKKISKFDMAIMNGVISLVATGNIAITPAMAYRTAAGWGTDHGVTQKQEEAARKSIERLRVTFVQIDATEEAKAYCKKRGIKKVSSWKRDGALLSCEGEEITLNGKKVKAYLFNNYDKNGNLKMPIIKEYADISGQILALPMELSDMPISATEDNIILKNYLWVQIGAIKNNKTKRRHEIAYEGIYKELEIDPSSVLGRKQAQRAREATEKLLENWKRKGAIKGYSIYKAGRKPAGIKIEA